MLLSCNKKGPKPKNFIVDFFWDTLYLSSNIVLKVYKLVASEPKTKEIVELMLAGDGVLLKMGS